MPKIRIESGESHQFYRVLAREDEDPAKHKTFDTMKDVFMLAFGFGVAAGYRTVLGSSREIFDDGLLRAQDWDLIKAAALSDDENNLAALGDVENLLRTAQEYANTGIRILMREYLSSQPEEAIASAVLQSLASLS
jgi:hypothetical protein